jgi:hypothetical protein
MPFRNDEDEDDLFDTVTHMADRMKLKGATRSTYIDDHMLQGGYQRVQSRESYARVKQEGEEGEEGSGSRWGFGSGGDSGGGRPRRTRSNEDDSF